MRARNAFPAALFGEDCIAPGVVGKSEEAAEPVTLALPDESTAMPRPWSGPLLPLR